MAITKQRSVHWHISVTVLVAIAAVAAGLLLGFLAGTRGPSAQAIADGLSTSPAIPTGAKLLKELGGVSGGSEFEQGRWDVTWSRGIILDVTGMRPEQIEAVPALYQSWFDSALPDDCGKLNWEENNWEWGTQGVANLGTTSRPKFSTGYGSGWSWRRGSRAGTVHLHCEVHVEVMDFDQIRQGVDFPERYPVKALTDPVRGQRVMYVVLAFTGSGLRDVKSMNWPAAAPASAPTTGIGS